MSKFEIDKAVRQNPFDGSWLGEIIIKCTDYEMFNELAIDTAPCPTQKEAINATIDNLRQLEILLSAHKQELQMMKKQLTEKKEE